MRIPYVGNAGSGEGVGVTGTRRDRRSVDLKTPRYCSKLVRTRNRQTWHRRELQFSDSSIATMASQQWLSSQSPFTVQLVCMFHSRPVHGDLYMICSTAIAISTHNFFHCIAPLKIIGISFFNEAFLLYRVKFLAVEHSSDRVSTLVHPGTSYLLTASC